MDAGVLAGLMACDGEALFQRAYWALLGREVDLSGLANVVEQRGNVVTQVRIATNWKQLSGSQGSAFLACAYQTLLGRHPDPDGFRTYLEQLRRGVPKIVILARLRHSEEFVARERQLLPATRDSAGGRQHEALLRRLDREIVKFYLGRLPLVGWLIRSVFQIEGLGALETRLRCVEFLLSTANSENDCAGNWEEEAVAPPTEKRGAENTYGEDALASNGWGEKGALEIGVPAASFLRSLPIPSDWQAEPPQ